MTHLVCNSVRGEKYKNAIIHNKKVLRSSWISDAWEQRNEPGFSATDREFTSNYGLRAFEGLQVAFIGFPLDEQKHMEDMLRTCGGIPSTINNDYCEHVVSISVIRINRPFIYTLPPTFTYSP